VSDERRHLQRVDWQPSTQQPPDLDEWPFTIPAVGQLVAERGLEIPAGVTFLVGENGSGKSTLVEALAAVYPRRGFVTTFVHKTGPEPSAEDSPLRWHLRARTHPQASPAGFFLRSELMHDYLAGIDMRMGSESRATAWGGETLQEQSHGESFLAVLRLRFAEIGVYFMDEPEAALSFSSCLGLVSLLGQTRREGSQVIVATHSPLLMSLPEATVLEVGEWGIRRVGSYDEIELVQSWRDFLAAPRRYLRHLVD
jgi:predicted ATPase